MNLRDLLPGRRSTGDRDGSRFGYAVVGLGHIAGYFLEALRDSRTCAVTALVSGNPAKARSLAKKYRVPLTPGYDEFDSLRDQPQVDAVYLALPVSMHLEFTQRAAAAGKHVLCEKPMASTVEEARAMIDACRSAGVELSIAYRCPYTLVHGRARYLVSTGALGDGLHIESGFGFELKPGWRTDPKSAGGGSLYDVGIYPLNASRYLLREEPSGVRDARAVCDCNGLEQAITWTSEFPSGATANCRSSYVENIPDTLRVTGSRGTLLLAPAFGHRDRMRLQGEYTDAASGRLIRVDEPAPCLGAAQFQMEAEHLAAMVRERVTPITPGEDGLADMVAMEAIYAAAGVSLP